MIVCVQDIGIPNSTAVDRNKKEEIYYSIMRKTSLLMSLLSQEDKFPYNCPAHIVIDLEKYETMHRNVPENVLFTCVLKKAAPMNSQINPMTNY
jgi:hypothetical protein